MEKASEVVMTHDMSHVMKSHELCNEGINSFTSCYDSAEEEKSRLEKSDWWFLVNQLEEWGVFAPRAIVKKNPAAAWRIMNLCKDNCVKVPGAYFTACFKKEIAKQNFQLFQKSLEKQMQI